MNLDEALQTFLAESRELLQDMESALLEVGTLADTTEAIGAIFRAAHTIKGSAGLFGLDAIVAFTHVAESALDAVRDGRLALTPELTTLLLECCDHIGSLVDAIGKPDDPALAAAGAPLVDRLRGYLGTGPATGAAPAAAAAAPPSAAARWHISLAFGPDVLRNGMDPIAFLRYLGKLGTIASIETSAPSMPDLDAMDPESCYLAFEIAFDSDAGQAAIEAVFDFVRDDCKLSVTPAAKNAAPAAAATAAAAKPAAAEARTVRVDADKLDRLINLVGELIIAGASANLMARRAQNAALEEATAALSGLVEEVRDSALQLRMVKIGATFGRFRRVVHDVARELGKDIVLDVRGEDTELDKTVVELIGDPLTHLVRNSMDHGIEPADVRVARGKPAQGKVTLNAYHDSGSIVIEVSDDGGGLKRDRILAKAVERGLVEAGAELSDKEVFALVFEAGFSTAEQVTNLSGRGVGMDVVKRNITALRGSVEISSREGEGTTVTVRLPLTLAIIDGFLVGLGRSAFVIPLDMIEECIEFTPEPGRDYVALRGEVLPYVRLRERFEIEGEPAKRQSIVVVRHAGKRAGLVVDSLMGEFQTVIKPLGKLFSHLRCLTGSTILGNGEVALILDVPALVADAIHPSREAAPALA